MCKDNRDITNYDGNTMEIYNGRGVHCYIAIVIYHRRLNKFSLPTIFDNIYSASNMTF